MEGSLWVVCSQQVAQPIYDRHQVTRVGPRGSSQVSQRSSQSEQRRASVQADHITNHLQGGLYKKGEVRENFEGWKASLLIKRDFVPSMFRGWSVPLSTRIMDPTDGKPPPCLFKGSLSRLMAGIWHNGKNKGLEVRKLSDSSDDLRTLPLEVFWIR